MYFSLLTAAIKQDAFEEAMEFDGSELCGKRIRKPVRRRLNFEEVNGQVLGVNGIEMVRTSMEFDGGELCGKRKRKPVRRRLNFEEV